MGPIHSPIAGHRRSLRIAAALLLLALAAGGYLTFRRTAAAPSAAEAWRRLAGGFPLERLNFVLVTIDTLRADRLGCYGSREVETPHIDALALQGVRFANAASTVPFTLPAHSSIMTGTYPPYHGVRENVGYFLDQSIPTLAELLRAAGRDTAGFVSAFVLDSRWGIARGFDRYFDDFDVRSMRQVNLGSVQRDGGETLAAAVRWLDGRAEPEKPFFLWLHLFDPHDPYAPPEPYRSRYPDRPYDGEVAYADALVGELQQALEDRNLLSRSLLVLTADHGEGLGDHAESFHGFYVYDSTVHVPLIVRPPFGELGGRVVDGAVSHVDLLPTLLAAAGRPAPESIQGRSLLPLVLGREEAEDRAVYSESYYPLFHYGWAPLRAIRTARHKLVDAPRPELYRLADDRREERNLYRDQRRLARDLQQRLELMMAAADRPELAAPQPDLDPDTLAQLRALGYVAGRGEVAAAEERDRPRADPKDKIEVHQAVMWAQSFIGRGDEEAAEDRLREVLELDPGMIDAHQMLGNVASRRGRTEEAAGHFRRALELDADHRASLFGLADAYRRLGRPDEALVGFRRLMALAPHDSKAALAVAEIHVARGEVEEALAAVAEAAEPQHAPALVHNQHGELLVLVGRPAEAEAPLKRALRANPRLSQPRFNLAVVHEDRGEVDRAVELYQQAIARSPRHYQAQFNLGRLYGRTGEPDRQQELYEAAIESNPDFARGYYFLAKLLMDRGGDLERAEALARQGLVRDPDRQAGPLGHYVLADVLNRRGRPAEARQAAAEGRRVQEELAAGGG